MSAVQACDIPPGASLCRYQDGTGYVDCYVTEVRGVVLQSAFIEAFYTSPLFKLERTLLRWLVRKPASDAQAKQLSLGQTAVYSAWRVEAQSASELLVADFTGRTRSWLMATPVTPASGAASTRLYFGSAVVPRRRPGGRRGDMGWPFRALLGFHRLYARLLLAAAGRRVGKAVQGAAGGA